jgi:hypothetical protein
MDGNNAESGTFAAVRNPYGSFWLAWIVNCLADEAVELIYFIKSGSSANRYTVESWEVQTMTQGHLIAAGLDVRVNIKASNQERYFVLQTPKKHIQQVEANLPLSILRCARMPELQNLQKQQHDFWVPSDEAGVKRFQARVLLNSAIKIASK